MRVGNLLRLFYCVFIFLVILTNTLFASDRSTYIPYASGVTAPMVLDAAHQQVFVAWTDLDRVEVLSTTDYHLIHTIAVPSPSSIDISPDGSTVAISTSGAHILFFNTTTFAKTDDIVFRNSALGISQVLYVGNGNLMVRAEEGIAGGGGITAYWDHASNSFTNVSDAMSFSGPYYTSGPMARSGDYSRVILGEPLSNGPVQIVDANSGSVLKTMGFDWYISGVAVNKDASRYAVCVLSTLTLLDSSFNVVFQDQSGCLGMTFSADGNTLYRDVVSGSSAYTQALNVTTFATHNTTNLFRTTLEGYSTDWKTADDTGMVYGTLSLSTGGRAFVAVDTTQSSTGSISTSDAVRIVRVIDNIGSAKGGDPIRILCTGLDNVSAASVTVTIGGVAATDASIVNFSPGAALGNMRILAVNTPPGTPGTADVVVRTSNGSDTATKAFQYASTTKTFAFATSPTFLLYDNFRNRLYASNVNEVEVIDVATQQVLSPLVPASGKLADSQFEGLSLSPDGARLYIADPGTKQIHVLNLDSPGTGTSIDPGALLGNPQSIKPSRVYEMASGRLVGSAGGLPDGGTYRPGIFVLDPSSGTGNWSMDGNSQISGLLWGTTKDGRYLFANLEVDGLISAKSSVYDDAKSQWIPSSGLTIDGMEAAFNEDGTVSAVGGSTPGIINTYPEIVDSDLNALGYIQDQDYIDAPVGTPSLSFQPSGALLYKAGVGAKLVANPGNNTQVGKVVIYDVRHWKAIGTVVFPDMLSTSYTPAVTHMFATDDAGRTLFASTPSGITMMVLHDVPLSIGNLQPTFGAQGSGQTVTVRGSGFKSGAVVSFADVQAATTFVDENTLTAVVPSSLTPGWQSITVSNPDGSTYEWTDAFLVLESQPVTPVITGFSPTQLEAGADINGRVTPLPVMVIGTGFTSKDTVEVEGELVDSAFADSTQIQALIPLAFTDSTGTLSFVVKSPYAGDSNAATLPVVNPVPVVKSVSPASLITGGTNQLMTVYGTGFVSNSQIMWNGQPLTTTLSEGVTSDGTEIVYAYVPAEFVASDGTANISVYNPPPAGGTSASLQVVIEPAHPVVILPLSIDFGSILVNTSSTQTLQLTNSGSADYFLTSATVTSGPFAVTASCPQIAIKPGYACAIGLKFTPTIVGPATGTLVLVDNTKGSPRTIALTGTGRAAVTRRVPADAATIQAAIDASHDGDTVTVGAGTYTENVDFKGKSISVISSDGASKTIIDAGQKGNGVTFSGGENNAVLSGFTIQNATGAGVSLNGANATISNNVITNNLGYGISLNFSGALVQGNVISNTKTNITGTNWGCDWRDGVGIAAGGTNNAGYGLTITGNTIENNYGQCEGAGIQLFAAPPAIISDNIIRNNQALGSGGAISLMNGNKITLLQNLIYGNQAGAAGGAIYLGIVSETSYASGPITSYITNNTIVNNTIVPNTMISGDYVDGSQVAFGGAASQAGFFNNIIVANDKYAAIACYPVYSYLSASAPVAIYNDLLNQAGPVFGGWCTTPSGTGANIAAVPKFVNTTNGDFHLLTGSPAIDAGDNAALGLQSKDLDSNARIQNGSGASTAKVDLGVYEFAGTANNRANSQATLSVQNATTNFGQPIVLTANVTVSSSGVTAGTVSLLDNWTRIAQASVDQNGAVVFTISSLSVGTHNLIAAFDGTSQVQESVSANVPVTVQGFATSTDLSFSANSVDYGQPETLTATVTSTAGTPTGDVVFDISDPTSRQVTAPLNAKGVATYTSNSFGVGSDYIQAIYQGQGGFLKSQSTNLPLQVQPSSSTIDLSLSTTDATAGQSVTFTSTLQTSDNATGTVYFKDNGVTFGSAIVNAGAAAFSTTTLAGGTHTITAYYGGDAGHSSATSSAITLVVRDFSITAGTAGNLVVTRGGSASSTLAIAPISGFSGAVNFSCAVPSSMLEASCSVTSAQLTGSSTQNATLTVTTAAPHQAMLVDPAMRLTRWTGLVFGITLIGGIFGCKRRAIIATMVVAILLIGLLGMCSCGGGASTSSGGGTSMDQGTPVGTYTLTITATSGTASHSMTQTVVVQ